MQGLHNNIMVVLMLLNRDDTILSSIAIEHRGRLPLVCCILIICCYVSRYWYHPSNATKSKEVCVKVKEQ